jgi:hypothetical protein
MPRRSIFSAVLLSASLAIGAWADPMNPADVTASTTTQNKYPSYTGSAFTPGKGFGLADTEKGSLNVSLYILARYLTQLPADQSFTDHLGNVREVDTVNQISAPHRILMGFYGWLLDPKFTYNCTIWTVLAIDKVNIIGDLAYKFDDKFDFHAGVGGMPGTRSILGSHPYWLGTDRVMADDYFRAGFTQGVWGIGELLPGFWYRAMVGNNISTLNVSQTEDTRPMAVGASMWWMPTTKEFGPRSGGYGDYEEHQQVATRFGVSGTHSRENRFTQVENAAPESTQIRLGDSIPLFNTGALANGVQVNDADFNLLATDAGMKYKGFFLQTEFYNRWLDQFHTTGGAVPVSRIHDWGFYVQGSKMIVPKLWELYAATSWIYPDKSAGFQSQSHEWIGGVNWYPWKTHNSRINLQFMDVYRSAASSAFGYYTGGQTGQSVSLAWSLLF